jgi:hypothetical protein
MRTNVYVDGFNLYYGCVKGTQFKWLNIARLSSLLLPQDHEIHRLRYFTARISARPNDPQAPTRQQIYLRALETIPNLSISFGHFLVSKIMMPLAIPAPGGPAHVRVIKTEEKGSDVNLASYLLLDAFRAECESALVISNDSDLLAPIRIARREFGLRIGLGCPHKRPSRVLQQEVDFIRPIRAGALQASQFPATLFDRHGTITKPSGW